MRVLVDTSAWVDFFNDFDSPEADALASLIREEADILTCGVVVAEVLQGLKQTKTLGAIERHFLEMEWLTPSEPKTSIEVANLYRKLRSRGVTIRSTIDCLIARLADEHGVLLLSKDRDIRLIVESGLVDVRAFPIA
jgi:predicted nucleic acid-binding protein